MKKNAVRNIAVAVLVALLVISLLGPMFGCTPANSEEAALDLVRAQATQDLRCKASDVTVQKMAQQGTSYEFQARGCDDIYTYGVECGAPDTSDGKCEIVDGVRGVGIGGLWNAANKAASALADEVRAAQAREAREASELEQRKTR